MKNLFDIIWSFAPLNKNEDLSLLQKEIQKQKLNLPTTNKLKDVISSLTTLKSIGDHATMEIVDASVRVEIAEFNNSAKELEEWFKDFKKLFQPDDVSRNILPVLISLLPDDKKFLEDLEKKIAEISHDALRIYDANTVDKLFSIVTIAIKHKKLNLSEENDNTIDSFKDKNEYILIKAQHELSNYQFQLAAKIIKAKKESNVKNLSTYKAQYTIIIEAQKKLSDKKTPAAIDKLKNAALILSENSVILRKDSSGFGKSILRKFAKIFSFIKIKPVSKSQRVYDNTNKLFSDLQKKMASEPEAKPEHKEKDLGSKKPSLGKV